MWVQQRDSLSSRLEEVAAVRAKDPAARRTHLPSLEAAAADRVGRAARLVLPGLEEVAAANREGPTARLALIDLGEADAADHGDPVAGLAPPRLEEVAAAAADRVGP